MQGDSPGFQTLEAKPVGSSNHWKNQTPALRAVVLLPRTSRASLKRLSRAVLQDPAGLPMPTVAALSAGAMNRASEAVTVHAYGIARAIVIGNDNGCLTRHEDPSPSHLLLEEKSSKCAGLPCGTPQSGVLISLSPPPSPAAPTQATPAELSCPVLNPPALSRLPCGTRTASTLDAGLCAGSAALRLPWCRARLDPSASSATPLLQSLLRHEVPSAERGGLRPPQRRR